MQNSNNLDVLRAFAVLLVVVSHALLYTRHSQYVGWMGLSGVCLFFVHTSLVLMWSLERQPNTLMFYVRRAFRLYPLWLVVLALVVLLKIPVAPPMAPQFGYIQPSTKELVANAMLLMNLTPQGARLVGASWSLPVEAQMYVLLPVLFFFVRGAKSISALLAIDALAFATAWAGKPWTSPNVTLTCAIPYFLPGVIAYAMSRQVQPRFPAWLFPLALCVFAVLHARYGNLPLSAAFCLAIGLILFFFNEVTWPPLVRTAHYVAKYSYGIYLCHIPALSVGGFYLRHSALPVRVAGTLLVMVSVPVLLFHGVEQPMIELGRRLTSGRKTSVRVSEAELELEPVP